MQARISSIASDHDLLLSRVQDAYDFVDSLEQIKVWDYQLVSSYPKKVLERDLVHETFQEAGLVPQATLFVQSLDD